MRLLVDTHVLMWFIEGSVLLAISHRQMIADPSNNVFGSIASLWEMAIKISIGKLTLAQPLADVIKQLTTENIELLAISPEHALQILILPFSPPRPV